MALYILIPISVVLVFLIGLVFWWSLRSGQFDDMEGPGFRLLVDDRDPPDQADPGAQDSAARVASPSHDAPDEQRSTRIDPDQTP